MTASDMMQKNMTIAKIATITMTERRRAMKDSKAYQVLQALVVESNKLTVAEKLSLLRLLFEQEDLAEYKESKEQKGEEDAEI
jgi:hypothetical protein